MIDTHCHLYVKAFDNDSEAVMERAISSGITKMFLPAIDKSCTERMEKMEADYDGKCFSMAGLHPCSVKENYESELAHIEQQLASRKFYGIGETGLDFYWDKTFVKEQYTSLERHIGFALQYELPLILHTRNATQETIDFVKKFKGPRLTGIFHCFGGTQMEAEQILELNFSLGIGGVVTYKNSGLAEVISNINLKHLVLETDAPYLAPAPLRGKRNESSYLIYIAQKLADIKGISVEEVKVITSANAEKIFPSKGE